MQSHELTDFEWRVIQPLLPNKMLSQSDGLPVLPAFLISRQASPKLVSAMADAIRAAQRQAA